MVSDATKSGGCTDTRVRRAQRVVRGLHSQVLRHWDNLCKIYFIQATIHSKKMPNKQIVVITEIQEKRTEKTA